MTIDKATKVIEDILNGKRSARATSGIAALKLGIEALKLTSKLRAMGSRLALLPLLGETKD